MALTQKGIYSYGDSRLDIQDVLREYIRGNQYPATQFADAFCSCAGNSIFVQLDDEVGAAVRTCLTCQAKHPIADSAEYLAEADLEECQCPCGSASFEMSVGVALYADSTDVKWLCLGLRCILCGLVACYGDWKSEYIGCKDLLLQI